MTKEPTIFNNIQNLKEIIPYTPLITAFLIFFGFLNYDLYYRKLEIDIFSFLETTELIFSFVNLIYPIIIAAIIYNLLPYLMVGVEKRKVRTEEEKKLKGVEQEKLIEKLEFDYSFKGVFANFKCMLVELKRRNFRIAWVFFKTIFSGITFKIIVFIAWVFGIVFGLILIFKLTDFNTLINLKSTKIVFGSLLFLLLSIFWVGIILIYITTKFNENNEKIGREIYAIIIVLVLIANLNVHQNSLASDTFNDLNVKNVRFNYKGKNINTNDTKSLIGVTKNYIFLRETSKNENLVFKLSDITDMVLYEDESLKEKGTKTKNN